MNLSAQISFSIIALPLRNQNVFLKPFKVLSSVPQKREKKVRKKFFKRIFSLEYSKFNLGKRDWNGQQTPHRSKVGPPL